MCKGVSDMNAIAEETTVMENNITMLEKAKEEIRNKKPIMAICYDFDKTLSPDDMQTFTLIPSLKMDKDDFWGECNSLAKENLMDNNLSWMYQLIVKSKACRQRISKEYFNQIGRDVQLYNGVKDWFDRVNKYGERQGVEIQHYIISSGLKEIIEGSEIAPFFKRIYASSYLYSADGVAEWPAQAINYTNKTQFIFRIAKGFFEKYDDRVNDSMPEDKLYIPYENIVYIGDSATDIPCMRLVKSKGGYSIGVYDPNKKNKEKVYKLLNDKRINYYAPADYSSKSDLYRFMRNIIDEVAVRDKMNKEQLLLKVDSSVFGMWNVFHEMAPSLLQGAKPKEKKEIMKSIENLGEMVKSL